MKRVYVNEEWCLGCHLCEYNCAFANSGSYYTTDEGGELYEEKTNNTLKRLFTRDGYLTGFILIGNTDTSRAGIYTSLIREHTPLNSIDFETLKRGATSTAFSYEKRKHIFGGVV